MTGKLALLCAALSTGGVASAQTLDLMGAVRQAEAHRPSVQAAELKLRAAEYSLKAATLLSPFRVEAGYGSFPTFGAGEDFLLALPIDVFGKNRAAKGVAATVVQTERAHLRQAKLDLQTEVLNSYAEAVAAQIQARTGRQLIELQQSLYDSTKKRVDAGDLPGIELTRSDLDLERAKAAAVVFDQSLKAARHRLSGAIGADVIQDVSETIESGLAAGPGQRPDILERQAAVDSAKADIRVQSADRLPDLELQFRRSPWGEPERYNLHAQLVWNVLDWGAGANRSRAARATLQASQKDLQDRVKVAASEVSAGEAEALAAQTSVESFARLEAAALALVQKEQRGYELGGNTLLGVLEATRALRDIQASVADAKLRLLQAEAKLLAAKGILMSESK